MKNLAFICIAAFSILAIACSTETMEIKDEQEGENYKPERSWSETASFRDGRVWNQMYTNGSGNAFGDDFDFDGDIDTLETNIYIESPLEEGKKYIIENAILNNFVNEIEWRKDRTRSDQRYKSISGELNITKVVERPANLMNEAAAYISGNYEATVVYQTGVNDTVELVGQFKDVFLNR